MLVLNNVYWMEKYYKNCFLIWMYQFLITVHKMIVLHHPIIFDDLIVIRRCLYLLKKCYQIIEGDYFFLAFLPRLNKWTHVFLQN